jgi:signal transduction histidine kinase/CheY-like chemotaxis protein
MAVHQLTEDEMNRIYLMREKSAHITKAARSATLANILAPLLCIPMFQEQVSTDNFSSWLGYMLLAVTVRTAMVFSLAHDAEKIEDPQRNLRIMTYAIGIVGFGWGLGWILMAPDLDMVNRMIYVYMTTAAMISSMFAYSVNRPTFLAFTLPIMIPSIGSVLWSSSLFPWPFTLGLTSLYIVVLSIAKSFAKIFEDSVSLRFRNERLYEELANERDASVAANVAKSKFIAIASHDLRQPMHAVNVYLELINLDNLPAAEKKSLAKIKNSITTLNDMFDSLLNTSKLDADVMQVSHRAFHLKELANTLRDLTETKATNKGLTLTVNCPDLMVRGDKLLLQQITSNLLSNAIQYTDTGGVSLSFDIGAEGLTIEVADTGCGIDPAEQQQIFNQFFRVDRTRALHDGLGLGLSIVKRLCNLIGAKISVFSEVNMGARFVVMTKFPASADEDDVQQTTLAPKVASQLHTLQGKCIAVIEDNPIIVEAYRHTLANLGAFVQVLSEHMEELDAQLETIDHIDCILCDYRLSQTTGDLVIERIRESYNDEIPAIIVTADTSPSHINFFAALHVQVLHKPISFHEIAQAIEKTITSRDS